MIASCAARRPLQDMPAGTELCYDYRFSSETEKLPCNCGTALCRGFVNKVHTAYTVQKHTRLHTLRLHTLRLHTLRQPLFEP